MLLISALPHIKVQRTEDKLNKTGDNCIGGMLGMCLFWKEERRHREGRGGGRERELTTKKSEHCIYLELYTFFF